MILKQIAEVHSETDEGADDSPTMICATHCPRCHAVLRTMFVHGHEQCVVCRAIVEDCCQGAPL